MTKLTRFGALAAMALWGASAQAALSWDSSPITTLMVQDDGTSGASGLVIAIMPTNMLYIPACHTSSLKDRFYVDLSRAPGKSQYAMLLAAVAAQRPVNISLNESCLSGIALLRNVDIAN